MNIVEVEEVVKAYDKKIAVDHLSLKIEQGSIAVGQKVEISGIPESPKVEVKAILAQLFRNDQPA